MNTLVLGATGFIGGQVVDALRQRRSEPVTINRSPQIRDLQDTLPTSGLSRKEDSLEKKIRESFSEHEITGIINCANHFNRQPSMQDQWKMLAANFDFPMKVLLAQLAQQNTSGWTQLGSVWEVDPARRPENFAYVSSKRAFRHILDSTDLLRSSKTVFTCDIIGPGDPRQKLIPQLVLSALEGRVIEVRSLKSTINVAVASELAHFLANLDKDQMPFQKNVFFKSFGPVVLEDLVDLIRSLTGHRGEVIDRGLMPEFAFEPDLPVVGERHVDQLEPILARIIDIAAGQT